MHQFQSFSVTLVENIQSFFGLALTLYIGLLIGQPLGLSAQVSVNWSTLQEVDAYDNSLGGSVFLTTSFSDQIVQLDGKAIQVTGYVIPLDIEGTEYALSAYPNASCFFCGAASPSSVMMLELKDKRRRFALDQYVTLQGVLSLNYQPDAMMYHLNNARLVRH